MPLAPGTRLGPYEVTAPIGAGGMGEVYRATDTTLGRDVALKILPTSFTNDPERVARFRREAQVLASLNHPHIAQIHGLDEVNGTQFLVLELVDGESLDRRIARGPIPLEDALGTAGQIAEALEAAHEKGIIHRDLKPANVALTKDGQVKVLDFGLAKASETTARSLDVANSPTITSPAMMTGIGVILGTAAYMSPEQAKGRAADKRSDIWAFGCVLFEMLTGKRAFDGDDVSETLAAVLTRDPDLSLLPGSTPPAVRRLLDRCLRRDSKRRLHDMADARIELEEAMITPLSDTDRTSGLPWVRVLPLLAASIVAGAIGAWMFTPASRVDRSVTKVLLDVQPAERLAGSVQSPRPSRTAMAFSPDGRTIVFSGAHGKVSQLFKRRLEDIEAAAIPGTDGAIRPFFSPSGEWVGFWADGKLKKVPVGGGPPVVICDVPADLGLLGASWGSDGSIVFASRGGIARVSAGGGKPGSLTHPDPSKSETTHILPFLLPGGKAMLYTVQTLRFNWEQTSIVAQSLTTGERRTLLQGGADARYVPSGHLLYLKAGTLMSVPFDAETLELRGSPVAVLDNVMQAIGAPSALDDTGAGQFDVSAIGSLVYLSGGVYPPRTDDLVWVDRVGTVTPLPLSKGSYVAPRVSPNGEQVAFFARRGGSSSRESDIWVYNIGRQNATRLTTQDNNDWFVWSPDSKRLLFHMTDARDFGQVSADGGGRPERMMLGEHVGFPASWSNAGNVLAFLEGQQPRQIWIRPMDGKGTATPFLQTPFDLSYPEFSPDRRWLAYVSPETGSNEVYVLPYPGPGEKTRISTDGGHSPAWAHNGRELFFLQGSADMTYLMVSDIDASKGFRASKPRQLFEWAYATSAPLRSYDIASDDQHFITTRRAVNVEPPLTQMHIILNWMAELKQRVPLK